MMPVVPEPPPTFDLCGFPVLATTYRGVIDAILERIQSGQGGWVVTINLEMISLSRRDPGYRQHLASADLRVADGMPIVWASHFKRGQPPVPERTAGIDLTIDLLHEIPTEKVAIIGGDDPIQGLQKIGLENPRAAFIYAGRVKFEPEFLDPLVNQILAHDSKLIFVALGVPKQDHFVQAVRSRIPGAVFVGVGGTFELMAGIKKRAPRWMQYSGLEWFFRLAIEPRRLWYRYLVRYWSGFGLLVADVLGLSSARQYHPKPDPGTGSIQK